MKKYQLTLSKESIAVETDAQKAESYASYALLENGIYICNNGNFEEVETKYFDTLEEVKEYILNNPVSKVKIDSNSLTTDIDSEYSYFLKEYNEEYEEYEESDAIENDDNIRSLYVVI